MAVCTVTYAPPCYPTGTARSEPVLFPLRPRQGTGIQGPRGLPLFKPPYSRLSAFDLNGGTLEWMVPLGDGPCQNVIDLGIADPGPLGGGFYTGRW